MISLRPLFLVLDDDPAALERVERELARRYGVDFRIRAERRVADALAYLEEAQRNGEQVALVLADQWMPDGTGTDVLAAAGAMHPTAKRALLIEFGAWGDRPTADAILHAMAVGQIDYYLLKPWRSPDEYFHRTVAEFVHEWWRIAGSGPRELTVIADRWSARAHDLRSLLERNGIPHASHEPDSPEAVDLLRAANLDRSDVPLVLLSDGRVLVDPSDVELAAAYGVQTAVQDERDLDVDVAIVGAGPAGLACAVYAASEGLRTMVVERTAIGGQAGSSSWIRNYLGFARGVTGAELAQRAYQQAWVFGSRFLLMRQAVALTRSDEGGYNLHIAGGDAVHAKTVVLAAGVAYRRLGIPELEALQGAGVFYGASVSEAKAMEGGHAVVVGAGNSAGQAAMHLSRYARSVTILVRSGTLADTMSQYLIDEIDAAANVTVRLGAQVASGGGEGRLQWLSIRQGDGIDTLDADGLFILIGAVPHTEWLPAEIERDRYGFVLTGTQVRGDQAGEQTGADPGSQRAPYETSLPGVFAVGDVRAGSVKRVASASGEGSVVIAQVHAYLASLSARTASVP